MILLMKRIFMITKNELNLKICTTQVGLDARLIVVLLTGFLTITQTLANDEISEIEKSGIEQATNEIVDFTLSGLSATHVNWHKPSGREISSSSIELSADGLRIRELGENAIHEILQDFKGQRSWLIDHERSVSHLFEMADAPETDSLESDLPEPDIPESVEPESDRVDLRNLDSFLGPVPCGLLTADEQGPGRWRGRRVRAFHCVDESNAVLTIEFIDDVYQIVVYRRTHDGFVDELRGLTDRTFNESHFIPPTEYRSVDKQEFFFGAPQLSPYSPAAD